MFIYLDKYLNNARAGFQHTLPARGRSPVRHFAVMVIHLLALLAIALYLAAAGGLARPLLSGGQPLNRLALTLASYCVLTQLVKVLYIRRYGRWL